MQLDFFQARYYSAARGRFNSPDPMNAGANPFDPQSWNGYAYVRNNPLALTDPSGMDPCKNGEDADDCVYGGDPEPVPIDPCWYCGHIPGNSDGGSSEQPQQPLRARVYRLIIGAQANPAKKTRASNVCLAVTAIKGFTNLGIGITKGLLGTGSLATTPATGPVGAVGAAYGFIGAAGQGTAGIVQIVGALSGNPRGANSAAMVLTTVTTLSGFARLVATNGDMTAASKAAGIESAGMVGLNGGMTGHLIDKSASWIQKLLLGADLAQTGADLTDLSSDGSCAP